MMVSGLLSGCVLLVAFALNTEGKAVSLDRQKRAPNFEIQRRRWQHTRLGRKRSSEENELWPSNDSVGSESMVAIDPAMKEEYVNLFVDLLTSAIQSDPELYQNFLAYPRSGRSSNPMAFSRDIRAMFSYPRLGRSGSPAFDDVTCCNTGVKSINGVSVCPASECCSGLREFEDKTPAFQFKLCIPYHCISEDKA